MKTLLFSFLILTITLCCSPLSIGQNNTMLTDRAFQPGTYTAGIAGLTRTVEKDFNTTLPKFRAQLTALEVYKIKVISLNTAPVALKKNMLESATPSKKKRKAFREQRLQQISKGLSAASTLDAINGL